VATRDPVPVFLWWTALASATFRGYGLAALIYFVTDADLEPLQLVLGIDATGRADAME